MIIQLLKLSTTRYASLYSKPRVTPLVTSVKFNNTPREHKAKLSHELLSGAAAYEV